MTRSLWHCGEFRFQRSLSCHLWMQLGACSKSSDEFALIALSELIRSRVMQSTLSCLQCKQQHWTCKTELSLMNVSWKRSRLFPRFCFITPILCAHFTEAPRATPTLQRNAGNNCKEDLLFDALTLSLTLFASPRRMKSGGVQSTCRGCLWSSKPQRGESSGSCGNDTTSSPNDKAEMSWMLVDVDKARTKCPPRVIHLHQWSSVPKQCKSSFSRSGLVACYFHLYDSPWKRLVEIKFCFDFSPFPGFPT